jgi:TonB family protein
VQANQKYGKEKMIKQLGMTVLSGLMLTGGAWAEDMPKEPPSTLASGLQAGEVIAIQLDTQNKGLIYRKIPEVNFNDEMLEWQNRHARVRLLISKTGRVKQVKIVDSTGLKFLDREVITAFKRALFRPYLENGVAIPVYAFQEIQLELKGMPRVDLIAPDETWTQFHAWQRLSKVFASRIYGNWQIPMNSLGLHAQAYVTISADGQVQAVTFDQTNGDKAFHESIQQAIERSAPFNLPEDGSVMKRPQEFLLSFHGQ